LRAAAKFDARAPGAQQVSDSPDPNLVFDVGLHTGQDSEFYLAKGFRVVAIEAMASLCDAAAARLSEHIESGRLTIVNAAIAEEPGPVTFYANPTSVWGTIDKDRAERIAEMGAAPSSSITVEGVRFADVLKEHGTPYYLKVDIEGADLLCLHGLAETPGRPAYISIESDKTSWDGLRGEFQLLTGLGYDRFKVVSQPDVPSQRCPQPALEGRYVDHRFESGASGLFGDEAPGRWLTERQAMRRYRVIYLRYWLYGDQGVLRRSSRFRAVRGGLRVLRQLCRRVLGAPGWYDTHAARS
jgi:FkbM family methyltransferase